MALQLGLLHQALKAAGVGDELARRASEEVAAYENQVAAVQSELASLRAHVDQQIAALRSEIASLRAYVEGRFNLLSWMLGTIGALVLAVLVELFVHG